MVKNKWLFLVVGILILLAGCDSGAKIDENNRPDKLEKDLKHYPYFFFEKDQSFNAILVIDDFAGEEDYENARMLLEHYKQYDESLTENIIKKYPSEVGDLTKQHSILIGSCTQEPHNQFINLFVDCLSMREDQSIIRIINNRDFWVLNVMGYSPRETKNAIEALINYEDFEFKDYHVEVVKIDDKLVVRAPR